MRPSRALSVITVCTFGSRSRSTPCPPLTPPDQEPYCDNGQVGTYAGVYKRGPAAGAKSYGGYSNYWRGPAHFAVAIPDNLDPAEAAPMLCGGVTVYSPLVEYGAGTKAKDVGILGIGGLGHFGILFGKAMGANITAISSSHRKDEDAKKLGAEKVLVMGDNAKEAFKGHHRSLDLIICASSECSPGVDEWIGYGDGDGSDAEQGQEHKLIDRRPQPPAQRPLAPPPPARQFRLRRRARGRLDPQTAPVQHDYE